jgi:hypothetical protein
MLNILTPSFVTLSFASLFKKFRLKAGYATLGELCGALADEGLFIDVTVLSRWQTGERIPHDRETILVLIKIFKDRHSIVQINEANSLLEATGYGFLTTVECNYLFPNHIDATPTLDFLTNNQVDADLISQAPTIIQSLRYQGYIAVALKTAAFFERQLINNHTQIKNREELLAQVYIGWGYVLGDFVYDKFGLQTINQMCSKSLEIGRKLKSEQIIEDSLLNLAGCQYMGENWQEAEKFFSLFIPKIGNTSILAHMLSMQLIAEAELNNREKFDTYRKQAESLASYISGCHSLTALLEAISRGLAVMGEINESKVIAENIQYNIDNMFTKSQMIKHQLITLYAETKCGRLIDNTEITRLENQAKNPNLVVYYRHQCQINNLLKKIKQRQIKT